MLVQIMLLKHDNLTHQIWNLDMTAGARKRSNESLITKVETLLAPFSSVAVAILLLPLAPSWTAPSSHSSGEPNYRDIAPLTPQSTQVIIRSNLARPSRWEEWGERLGERAFSPAAITANLSTPVPVTIYWLQAGGECSRYGKCNHFRRFWVKRCIWGARVSIGYQKLQIKAWLYFESKKLFTTLTVSSPKIERGAYIIGDHWPQVR